ncbi:MAG: Cna B-type domain-containing protein [Clostridia bacterium]|nr:Cna B-type domain-containing protein [Clostridia bacterium]
MGRKTISVFLIALFLLVMPITVFAQGFDSDRVGSVSVTLVDQDAKTPIEGAELSLYRVATVKLNRKNNLSYTFTNAFKDCGCALDDPALSGKLDAFVEEISVPDGQLHTDADGNAAFTNLPLGLYFVKQTNTVAGYAPCTSFLVTVPYKNADGYVYDVNASPKTDIARLTDITVKKVWNTDASTKAADSVTVQLLRDGVVVETAVLSAQNHWQVTYTDLPESDLYSIVELNIPKGFTATYTQSGYVFTVTNSASLIQTGQLIWPIPVLAMVGLCLITAGTIVLRKTRNENA